MIHRLSAQLGTANRSWADEIRSYWNKSSDLQHCSIVCGWQHLNVSFVKPRLWELAAIISERIRPAPADSEGAVKYAATAWLQKQG